MWMRRGGWARLIVRIEQVRLQYWSNYGFSLIADIKGQSILLVILKGLISAKP